MYMKLTVVIIILINVNGIIGSTSSDFLLFISNGNVHHINLIIFFFVINKFTLHSKTAAALYCTSRVHRTLYSL